jgi:hypothetical protein
MTYCAVLILNKEDDFFVLITLGLSLLFQLDLNMLSDRALVQLVLLDLLDLIHLSLFSQFSTVGYI